MSSRSGIPFYEQWSSIYPCRLQYKKLPVLEFLCPYNVNECCRSIFSSVFLFLGIRVCSHTIVYTAICLCPSGSHVRKSKSPTPYYTDIVSFDGEFLQYVYIPSTIFPCYSTNLPRTVISNTLNFLLCSSFMVQVCIDCTKVRHRSTFAELVTSFAPHTLWRLLTIADANSILLLTSLSQDKSRYKTPPKQTKSSLCISYFVSNVMFSSCLSLHTLNFSLGRTNIQAESVANSMNFVQ